jgi:hypothetical protein
MLPHRFVDVFETVSIIGDFYVRAIRRTARLPRQTMLLTHMAPPSPTARLSLEKSWSIFCRLLPAETPIRQAFGQQLVK